MSANKNYTFSLNVSTGCYPTKKPEKPFNIQYGTEDNLTIDDFDRLQRNGKSFCYLFRDVDESGLVTQHEKTLEGFASTSVLFFDIDKMQISMTEYIEPLPFQPSYAYTSYSNGIEKEFWKYGYRLMYVFDEPVTSIQEFDELYYSIAAANGFQQGIHPDGTKYGFDYRKVNQQYYGGGSNSQTFKTYIVYSKKDFAPYNEKGLALQKTISGSKPKKNTEGTKAKKESFPNENNIAKEATACSSDLENPFFTDFHTLPTKEFLEKYQHDYIGAYFSSISTPLVDSGDERYMFLPKDYQEIKPNWTKTESGKRCVEKWAVDSGRKKRLYVSAQIMKHNLPDITKEELIYNLVFERFHYYDNSDGDLNNGRIEKIAESALKYSFELAPKKHKVFTVNKEYCASVGLTPNSVKNTIRKELKEQEVLPLYDFNMSVKENLQVLKENGIKVSKSYLYELRKRYAGAIPNENNIAKESEAYCSDVENDEQNVLIVPKTAEQSFISQRQPCYG